MHNQEHNNHLPFDFRRSTDRELHRLGENYQERGRRIKPPEEMSPTRATGRDVADASQEMSPTRATEGDVEIDFRREREREREREKERDRERETERERERERERDFRV